MQEIDSGRCAKHPGEHITNYCIRDDCYVELCASCIGSHTDYHAAKGTKPEYINIKEAYTLAANQVSTLQDSLTEQKVRIKSLIDSIEENHKRVKAVISRAKEDAFEIVSQTFDEIERGFNQQLEKEKERTGSHNHSKLMGMYEDLNKHCLTMFKVSKELNRKQSKCVRKVFKDILPQLSGHQGMVKKVVSQNQMFKPDMIYSPGHLKDIERVIKKSISTSFSYPFTQSVRDHSRTPTKREDRNYGTFDRSKYEQMGLDLQNQNQKSQIRVGEKQNFQSTFTLGNRESRNLLRGRHLSPNFSTR